MYLNSRFHNSSTRLLDAAFTNIQNILYKIYNTIKIIEIYTKFAKYDELNFREHQLNCVGAIATSYRMQERIRVSYPETVSLANPLMSCLNHI